MSFELKTKKQLLEEALTKGMVRIEVDATKPGVKLPDHLLGDPRVPLNLSWRFRTPMEIRDDGVYAELSFNGRNESVVIPWITIWALEDAKNDIWIFTDAYTPKWLSGKRCETMVVDDPQFKLEPIEGGSEITPPRKGHLKLLPN